MSYFGYFDGCLINLHYFCTFEACVSKVNYQNLADNIYTVQQNGKEKNEKKIKTTLSVSPPSACDVIDSLYALHVPDPQYIRTFSRN